MTVVGASDSKSVNTWRVFEPHQRLPLFFLARNWSSFERDYKLPYKLFVPLNLNARRVDTWLPADVHKIHGLENKLFNGHMYQNCTRLIRLFLFRSFYGTCTRHRSLGSVYTWFITVFILIYLHSSVELCTT